jgi:molecular chaperone DnaK (HSP70)
MSNDVTVETYPGDYPEIVVEFDDGEETFEVEFTREQAEDLMNDLVDGLNELVGEADEEEA